MHSKSINITLHDGKQVPLEEFEKWTAHQQNMYTAHPLRSVVWGLDHSSKMSQIVKEQYESGKRPKPGHFGKANRQSVGVRTPLGEFYTLKEASIAYQVSSQKIHQWIKERPTEFSYLHTRNAEEMARLRPGPRSVKTPDGIFQTINSAAKHFGVSARTIKTWIRTMRKDEFQYVDKQH